LALAALQGGLKGGVTTRGLKGCGGLRCGSGGTGKRYSTSLRARCRVLRRKKMLARLHPKP
jgi:hypothetical protein